MIIPNHSLQSEQPQSEEGQRSQIEQRKQFALLEQVIGPEFLKLLTGAGSDFSYHGDTTIPPGELGYTNMDTKQIFFNPQILDEMSEDQLRGFLIHEAGHHDPEVKRFQDLMQQDLGKRKIILDVYQSPTARAKFFAALHRHLHNALSDIWNESYMSRNPFKRIKTDIDAIYESIQQEPREFLKSLPLPEQLTQILIGEHRYPGPKPIRDLVDFRVYQVYQKLIESGALDVIADPIYHEDILLSTEPARRMATQRKYDAYYYYILPEYLELLKQEIEDRKKQAQQQKNQQEGKKGEGKPSSVPLTDKEIDQIAQQLAEELENLGKQEYGSKAPSKDEVRKLEDKIKQIEEREKTKQKGKEEPEEPGTEPEEKISLEERMKKIQEELENKRRKGVQRGLEEKYQVGPEIIITYQRIKKQRRQEINNLSAAIYEIFRASRLPILDYMRREGEPTPGLEYETISAYQQGELEPETMMDIIIAEKFLETEIVFLVDTSYSMLGNPIEKSIEAIVVLNEAFQDAKKNLADEHLIRPNEDPLKVGVVSFDIKSNVVHRLGDPIDEAAEINIINKLSAVGGGTEDYKALKPEYEKLRLHIPYVLKIIVVLTDGHGDRENIAGLVRKIEEDDEVLLLVIGLGSGAEGIRATYLGNIRKGTESNVYAVFDSDCSKILPTLIEFLRKQVTKKTDELERK